MHEVRTEIDIEATPARVWGVLTDSRRMRSGSIRPFDLGLPQAGKKLVVSVQPEGGRAMTFKPTVLAADARQQLRWRGNFLIPGLFDVRR